MTLFIHHALAFFRGVASFAALAAGFACLGWLGLRLEAVSWVTLAPWHADAGAEAAAPVVVVDAGHGGHDGGAVVDGLVEKTLALDLAKRVRKGLNGSGVRVVMTRETDVFLPLGERSALTEKHAADAFVSLHLNTSVAATDVSGIETYFSTQKPLSVLRVLQARLSLPDTQPLRDERGAALARSVQRHACKATGAADRGSRERGYAVVANTACPAVLVECGFLTHESEVQRLRDEAYRDQLAEGIARGVVEFLKARQSQPLRGVHAVAVQSSDLPASEGPP